MEIEIFVLFKSLINLSGPNLIFLRYNRNSVSFCNLEDRNKLINNSQDIIVDLNTQFNIELCRLIDNMNCNYKIGFKSMFSDYFFNFQLDIESDQITENGFKRIQKILM